MAIGFSVHINNLTANDVSTLYQRLCKVYALPAHANDPRLVHEKALRFLDKKKEDSIFYYRFTPDSYCSIQRVADMLFFEAFNKQEQRVEQQEDQFYLIAKEYLQKKGLLQS